MTDDVKLKNVTRSDFSFLYNLLDQRNPIANISHKKMPTYEQHVKFCISRPYSKWYVILHNNQKIGSIYLSNQDEIGIFIINSMQGKGIGKRALKLLMKYNPRLRFLANISPKNKESMEFFTNSGFKLIQYTYELAKSKHSKKI